MMMLMMMMMMMMVYDDDMRPCGETDVESKTPTTQLFSNLAIAKDIVVDSSLVFTM